MTHSIFTAAPTLRHLVQLSRAKMTVLSAATYLAAALLAPALHPPTFLRGWLFILLTQFATHFLGEVYDLASDRLNKHATPLTGGSKVLLRRALTPLHALRLARLTSLLALLSLLLLPARVRPLALLILLLALAYSAPPLALNHRALGELDAALITSLLVPYFSFALHSPPPLPHPLRHPALPFLLLPPFFAKIALFLVLNLADRRPDAATRKRTLAVVLGPLQTARLHLLLMRAAYLSALLLALRLLLTSPPAVAIRHASVLLFLLPSAPYGLAISRALANPVPYRLDPLLAPTLLHSTFLVWGILLHAWLGALPTAGLLNFQTAFAALLAYFTFYNIFAAPHTRPAPAAGADVDAAADPKKLDPALAPAASAADTDTSPDPTHVSLDLNCLPATPPSALPTDCDVTVVGAGVAGLVAAATLIRLRRRVVLLERRTSPADTGAGADLALWPAAITILKTLGVPSDFFDTQCFPLHTVHLCNMQFSAPGSVESPDAAAPVATVLKTLNMDAVTHGTGESFVLVSRERLMRALLRLVPPGVIVYGADVIGVTEHEDDDSATTNFRVSDDDDPAAIPRKATLKSRIVIAADGARSRLRGHVSAPDAAPDAVAFCGEVCYRGVLDLSAGGVHPRVATLLPDPPADRTMRINYGAGLRSSFGHMSADGSQAYWWVKVPAAEMPRTRTKLDPCPWPEPLKSLHDATPDHAFYMHAIEDGRALPGWSSPRVALVGDAAHVVTPNMAQGACLAAEDAFVLAAELATYWHWPDGHLEAFAEYERKRRPYAEAVAAEARKQLFLGQLQSRPAVFLRETLLQLVPSWVLEKTLRRNNFPVQAYLDVFRDYVERGDRS